jgi:PKD domain/Ubiquitin-activating enzyme E1 FCCH domain/RTX calcium-binding nonapeptide repeat (4 copies)
MRLRPLLGRLFTRPAPVRRAIRPRTRQLRMTTLEDRTVPAVSILNGGGNGIVGVAGGNPPDTCGAVGPSSYIEAVFSGIKITNKTTGATIASDGLSNFLYTTGNLGRVPNPNGSDPTIIYDDVMGRFVIGDLDADVILAPMDGHNNVSIFDIAVSKTNNPTAFDLNNWNFYSINTTEGTAGSTAWGDYPGNPGYNADAVVLSFNMFGNGPGRTQIVSIDANDLANGVSQASLRVYRNDVNGGGVLRPTSMHDSVTGDPMWLIQDGGDGANINVYRMTNAELLSNGNTLSPPTQLSIPGPDNFTPGVIVPQNPDGSTFVKFLDDRIQKAAEYNNVIVATQHVQVSGTELDAQWYAIDVSGAAPAFQQVGGTANVGRIGFGGNTYVNYPGIDINSSGEIGLSYMESDKNGGSANAATGGFMSMFVTARKATDAAGTMQPSVLVAAGKGTGNIAAFATAAITNASNASPIVVTTAANHGYSTGDTVNVSGVSGNTAANGSSPTGFWTITVIDPTHFSLNGSTGNGAYTGGGTAAKNVTRIGDFSGLNTDPANGTFWAVNEFGNGGGGNTAIADFTPEAPPVVTAPSDQTANEGASKSFNLGSFADADGSPWTVRVSWGDGSPDTVFTQSAAGSLGTRSHTYAEEGNKVVTVTVTDNTTLSDSKTFNVNVSDLPVAATGGFLVNAVEGAESSSQTVATFVDPGGAEALGDYSASIAWGDGTTTPGTITFGGTLGSKTDAFTVSGHHTYAEESAGEHPDSNPYTVTITIGHELTTAQVVLSHAHVTDPPVDATGGFTFVAVEGDPSATQTVATFTDPGGAEVLADYSAVIDWGDGTTSVGAITFGGALGSKTDAFTVSGSHTYAVGLAEPGEFGNTFCDADPPSYHKPITVTVTHEGIVAVPAVSDAKISLKPGTAHLTKLGSLIVVGTPADDTIVVNNVGGKTRTVTVQLGSSVLGTFTVSASGRIVVAAMGGNDSVQVAGGITVQSVQYGGPGNDRLKGGGGRNILIGCDGDDTLTAGNLGDLLVGGAGADRLVGGNGNDLLVSALLVDGLNNEDDGYTDLVTILTTGSIPAPLHVLDDGVVDKLTGGGGTDTAYYNFTGVGVLDIATDGLEIGIDI